MKEKNENFIQNRTNIIEHTIDIAAQTGLPSVSMRAIAKKAGLDTSTLYYYFKNKEEILYESILHINNCIENEIMKLDIAPSLSDEETFKTMVKFMYSYLVKKPNHASTMRQSSIMSDIFFNTGQRDELFKQTTQEFRLCRFIESIKNKYNIIAEFGSVVTFFCYMPIYDLAMHTYGPASVTEKQLDMYIDSLWKSIQN